MYELDCTDERWRKVAYCQQAERYGAHELAEGYC